MKTTDFARYLTSFMTDYLIGEKGFSHNTVRTYRDTFIQFIKYMEAFKHLSINKITLADITKENVRGFLMWIETDRYCSIATRNVRLAALQSYVRYVQCVHPDYLYEFQKVLTVRSEKHETTKMSFLSIDGIRFLLEMPDRGNPHGCRDLAILSLMYDTGCRVQEVVDLNVENVHLDKPYFITIKGKSGKIRNVPMVEEQLMILRQYMQENGLLENTYRLYPLFSNNHKKRLTKGGITHILKKYVLKAHKLNPILIPRSISRHSLRHSKIMHLLQGGLNLMYIRYPNLNIILTLSCNTLKISSIISRKFG